MRVKKQQLELYMEQLTGSKLGKEYDKAVLSACLFNIYGEYIMWNARLDKLQAEIKIAPGGNINNLRYADDTTLMAENKEKLKSLLMREKVGLKLNFQRTKIMASVPITSRQIEGEKWKEWQILFSWVPKSLQTMSIAIKLKDTCSLEGKLWKT